MKILRSIGWNLIEYEGKFAVWHGDTSNFQPDNVDQWFSSREGAELYLVDLVTEEEESEVLLGQEDAAQILAEITGERWDRSKVHHYWKRGVLPEPLFLKGKSPLWSESQIRNFAKRRMGK
jgi:predicted DNA-binding transcriptional regulator AlpA